MVKGRKHTASSSSSTLDTTHPKKRRHSKTKTNNSIHHHHETSTMWGSSKSSSKKKKNDSGITEAHAEALFAELADPEDPTTMNMEGIFQLGEKLGMDATEDIRILVLLWKMQCHEKPSQVSKTEWMQGCITLQVDSWDKFQNIVPSLDTGFLDQTEFKDFYKFCFQFNRQGTHRTLDKDLVIALLKMVLTGRIDKERLDTFCTFVETNSGYSRITLDQWTSFLDFCYECEDLTSYDESTSAWPVMIDEYVEYMEEQQKKQKS